MSGLGEIVGQTGVYHVPLAFQCMFAHSKEGGENREGKEGCEICRGGERLEIIHKGKKNYIGARPLNQHSQVTWLPSATCMDHTVNLLLLVHYL